MIKSLKRLYSQFLLGLVLLCTTSIHAQQTHLLLDPAGAGGFELGETFESNGWTVVNGTQTNQWVLGSIPTWFAGERGAYITNNVSTKPYAYTTSSASIVHFYKDVVFQPGLETITISLDVSQAGEGNYDNVLVYLVDTNVEPNISGPSGLFTTYGVLENPGWVNYLNNVTGYFLGRKTGTTTANKQTLTFNLSGELLNYVSGNTKRLVISWRNDSSGGNQPPGSVDNVKIQATEPACGLVDNITFSNIEAHSFMVSWDAMQGAVGYEYELRNATGSTVLFSGNSTTTSVVLNESIINNTVYRFYVRKICVANSTFSPWRYSEVRTGCGIATYFLENFSSTRVGSSSDQTVPFCWSFIDSGAGSGFVSTASNYSTPNGFQMTNGTDVTGDYLLVSPQTDNLGNGLARVRFRAKTSVATAPATLLQVVSLSNNENTTGMVNLQNISLTTDYLEYVVYLPAGTNDYFAFKHGLNAASRVIYIDDVRYESIPTCASPSPLTVQNVNDNSVTVTWNVLNGQAGNSNLIFDVRKANGTQTTPITGTVNSAAGQVTITGLSHSTDYLFSIYASCGSTTDTKVNLNFTTSCQIVTDLFENFNTTPTNGSATFPIVPTCWGAIDSGAGYVYVTAGSASGTGRGLAMSNGSDTSGNYILVSPETNNLGNGGYRLRFKAKTTSTSTDPITTLEVVTLANQNSVTGMQVIAQKELTTTYTEFIVNLPANATLGHDYFGLRHGLGASSRLIYIDDVYYEPIPTCPSPNFLSINSLTSSSVTFSWPVVSNPNASLQYQYEVRTSGLPGSGNVGFVTTDFITNLFAPFTISNLNSNTNYTLYLRGTCGGANDIWVEVPFTTLCGVYPSIEEYFDTTTTGTNASPKVPTCWSFVDGDESASGYVSVTSGTNVSTANRLTMYSPTNSTADFLLISPETENLGSGTKQLRFFAYSSTAGNELVLGKMDGNSESSSFTPIATYTLGTSYSEFEYQFTDVAETDDFFAFKIEGATQAKYIYIDNVFFEDIPACSNVLTNTLSTSLVTTNQAVLSWSSNATNFDIEYGVAGFTQGSGTILTNVSNNYELTELTPGTNYQFYVRSNCGANGIGTWSSRGSFTTQYLATSPWFEGFATTTLPSGFTSTPNASSISANYNSVLPIVSNYIAYNIFGNTTAAYKTLETLNIANILPNDKLSFNYNFAYWTNGIAVNPVFGDLEVHVSTDFGQNYSLLATMNSQNIAGWQIFEASLAPYVGQTIKVKFVMKKDITITSDFIIALDNINIGSCFLSTVPTITNSTINSVSLAIEGPSTNNYQIEYGPVGFVQGTGTIFNFSGNSATISGLAQSTKYDYYIRKICSPISSSPYVGRLNFMTSCAPVEEGFEQNFDTTTTGSATNLTVPDCWSFIDTGLGYGFVAAGNTTNLNSVSAPNHFYMYNGAGALNNNYILVSPETNNLGNGAYQVTFKAKGDAGTALILGTLTNKLDPSTFEEIHTFELSSDYQTFTAYLPVTEADYFGLKHFASVVNKAIRIDDVVYEPITTPECALPINLKAVKNFNNMSAQLTWMSPGISTANTFEVEWGVAGFEQGTGSLSTVNTNSKTVTNLNPNENYSFYVRRICTEGNTNWVGPFVFDMNYCTPPVANYDDDGIVQMTIANSTVEVDLDTNYLNLFDTDVVAFTAGEQVEYTFLYNTAGDKYFTHIWIDLNNDGVFSDSEKLNLSNFEPLLENETEGITHILQGDFVLPNLGVYPSGEYRMRLIGLESNSLLLDPCAGLANSFTVDLKANISFPCIQPTDVNFVDTGFDYTLINWDGQGANNYEIEYGVTGFVPGNGTLIQNVSKPYLVEGLTPGTTYDFYIRKVCSNTFSDWSTVATNYIFCNAQEPTGESSQTLVEDELLSSLVIQGENLKFYTDPGLTNEVPASTPVVADGTYFVTQTLGCESDSYLIVNVSVIIRIDEPIATANQQFCDGASVSDLYVQALPGAVVKWYTSLTSTEVLTSNTELVNGTYYVEQTDGETTSHRVAVNVIINQTPVDLVSRDFLICGYSNFASLQVGQLPGVTMKWYTSLTSTTPISNNQQVVTGTFYVTQSNGICESNRVAVNIVAFESLPSPIAATQTFCGSAVASQLVAQGIAGAQLKWYASLTSTVELTPNTQLATGTYYVEQHNNGCVSPRRAVAVRIVSLAAPVVSPFILCGSSTVSDLYIPSATGVTYKWYTSPTSSNELAQNTPLQSGVYFVEKVQNGCSSQRASVNVTILALPDAPTGHAVQTFIEGSVLSDLVLDQSNVVWYISYNDSQNGVNPLVGSLPLVNGTTYYAVVIGNNGCASLPFAVTVNVYLSSDNFDQDKLKYYPNPVTDNLTISYIDIITDIQVYDLTGKLVKTLKSDSDHVNVNLSDLPTGTYMIQLSTDSKKQFIKIIKK